MAQYFLQLPKWATWRPLPGGVHPSVSPSLFHEMPARCHFNEIETGCNCQGRLGDARLKWDRFPCHVTSHFLFLFLFCSCLHVLIFGPGTQPRVLNTKSRGESLGASAFLLGPLGKSCSVQISWGSSGLAACRSFRRIPVWSQEDPGRPFPVSLVFYLTNSSLLS